MMLRSVFSAILALFASAEAHAEADEPFDGYNALCGYEIVFRPNLFLSTAEITDEGDPLIVLDPNLLEPRQKFHRLFLIAHECAHHRLEHTTQEGLKTRSMSHNAVSDQELSADCWASEHLASVGYSKRLERIADEFYRRGFISPGQGYPAGIQRSNMIRLCAGLPL